MIYPREFTFTILPEDAADAGSFVSKFCLLATAGRRQFPEADVEGGDREIWIDGRHYEFVEQFSAYAYYDKTDRPTVYESIELTARKIGHR